MDQTKCLGALPFLKFIPIYLNSIRVYLNFIPVYKRCGGALFSLVIAIVALMEPARAEPVLETTWMQKLQQSLVAVDEAHSGELGVYVKDLSSGVTVSLRGEESWYLASGIKVPVAIAVLRAVEQGRLSLDTTVRLAESDYVDGAGHTNRRRPGSRLPVRFLLEQMLVYSDNTASDLLIGLVGLEQVNQLVHQQSPEGFGTITTLADVRRHAYSGFHPAAFKLTGRDFLRIKAQGNERRRIDELARLLSLRADELALGDFDSAFAAYYRTDLNTGSLTAYGTLLESLVNGQLLQPEMTAYLMDVLFSVKTGTQRIKAGLPSTAAFAHKTGTQHRRICDLGVAVSAAGAEMPFDRSPLKATAAPVKAEVPSAKTEAPFTKAEMTLVEAARGTPAPEVNVSSSRILITACSRDFSSLADAESALRQVGEALTASGIFTAGSSGAVVRTEATEAIETL